MTPISDASQKSPMVLCILDGFGLAPKSEGNAIDETSAPTIFRLMKEYPSTELNAHGEAVGLFQGQSGNSESGHFTIGAGRVVLQDLVRISAAIADGTFFQNSAFEQALLHAKKYKSDVHILGLLTDNQSPHARPDHLYALLEFLRREKHHENVYLHLFTDGRDSPPHSAIHFLKELRSRLEPNEHIASIMGRLYAMDRNKNWERTQTAYNAIVCGKAEYTAASAEEAIAQAYNRGETDEFIKPTRIECTGVSHITNDDVVYFFNARSDRARQLTKAIVQTETFLTSNPGAFERSCVVENIKFVAMTDFGPDLPGVLNAFPSEDVPNCLAKAIGEHRKQLFISESEKYAHVTFFLNGGYPEPINGEKRYLVKSKNAYNFADQPEMESEQITNILLKYLEDSTYDFICVNYPNADMVGHTGNIAAARAAVRAVDTAVDQLSKMLLSLGGTLIITADHGNAEDMKNLQTGEVVTEHSLNPVPCIIVNDSFKNKSLRAGGGLADIAPTVLDILNINPPEEMTGRSLFV